MHDAYYGARQSSGHIDLVANKENADRKVDAANNRARASAAFSALSSFGGPYLAPVGKVGAIGATLAGVSDYSTVVDSGWSRLITRRVSSRPPPATASSTTPSSPRVRGGTRIRGRCRSVIRS